MGLSRDMHICLYVWVNRSIERQSFPQLMHVHARAFKKQRV